MTEKKQPSQPAPDWDPRFKFRMGLALMGTENVRLYLEYLRLTDRTKLRETAFTIIKTELPELANELNLLAPEDEAEK